MVLKWGVTVSCSSTKTTPMPLPLTHTQETVGEAVPTDESHRYTSNGRKASGLVYLPSNSLLSSSSTDNSSILYKAEVGFSIWWQFSQLSMCSFISGWGHSYTTNTKRKGKGRGLDGREGRGGWEGGENSFTGGSTNTTNIKSSSSLWSKWSKGIR